MALSEKAKERLADIVALQPTKNGELLDRWGLESGSEVHAYLEDELKEYYYRDENSLIRATPEAAEILGMETGDEIVRLPELQAQIVDVIAGPDDDPQSVVSVLKSVRETGLDPTVDEVRSALHSLDDRGLVELLRRTVPTFRLAVARDDIEIERLERPPEP